MSQPKVGFNKIKGKEQDEQLLMQCRVSHKQKDGYLHITNYRLLFTLPGVKDPTLSLPWIKIHESTPPLPSPMRH
jgi:hypothetical protein